MVIIGSITGNKNTLAGNIPPQADLGNLEGFKAGFKYPNVMINGGEWEAPKAYKDAKVGPQHPSFAHARHLRCGFTPGSLIGRATLAASCSDQYANALVQAAGSPRIGMNP